MATPALSFRSNPDPESSWVDVSPSLAEAWLQTTPDYQRRLRETWVMTLALDMEAGRWRMSHQGIAFDKFGFLLDGQHRLAAIILSRQTVRMRVTRNVDPDVFPIIDGGLARNLADRTSEAWVSESEVATARRMMYGLEPQWRPVPSGLVVQDYIRKHQDAIQFTASVFTHGKRRINVAPVRAVVARAWYTAPHTELSAFVAHLYSGMIPDARLHAVVRLRDTLLGMPTTGGGLVGADIYARTSRALRAYLDRQPISKLYAASTEIWPVPE